MKLNVQLFVRDEELRRETIELSADKFAPLSEEEQEAAIETIIRDWFNQHVSVKWELEE